MARINTNISALTAQRNLNLAYRGLHSTMDHLATGLRISRGKDDPAGLIVSERLRSEISAAGQAIANTQRAKLVVATAEGALDEVASLLKDIKAKIVEAANEGAFSEDEIRANQLQIDSAIDSITRIANTTSFAGRKLLDGSLAYEVSGLNMGAIPNYHIYAAQFGDRPSVGVNLRILQVASQAAVGFPYAALSADATIEVRGPDGATTISFSSGTTAAQIASAVAAVSDATGITAVVSTNPSLGMRFISDDYGERAFVQVREISGSFRHKQFMPMGVRNDEGRDTLATINGETAAADGLKLSIKNTTLELDMIVQASAYTTNFNITGGGALFQVGPRVNTNMQLNMAIDSVHATQLGGIDGYLSELKTGGRLAITNATPEWTDASNTLDDAIDMISKLRGRLGSMERNSLDTNMNQLGITVENLTSAESAIRDADFAYETSRLARDQILVNAGTTVLTLANQTTQSVLRLLGG